MNLVLTQDGRILELGQLGLEHSPLGHRRHGSCGFMMRAGRPVLAVGDSYDSVREALC